MQEGLRIREVPSVPERNRKRGAAIEAEVGFEAKSDGSDPARRFARK